jgi:histidinol-phosphate phosphatase family protein
MEWAVFLDRDGTLVKEAGLVTREEQLVLLPGVVQALRRLQDAGAYLAIVTNQPVIARGMLSEEELELMHERFLARLKEQGIHIKTIMYCAHHPETHHPEANDPTYRRECDCRKPKPGMIKFIAKNHDIDLAASFMVGDSVRDVGAGRAAGCRTVLVRTGVGDATAGKQADSVCADLSAAAEWILEARA